MTDITPRPLSERVERLRKRRRHTHCKLHPQWRINDEGQVSYCPACFKEKTKSGWFDCTDYHGDPREARKDAEALAWDLAPEGSEERRLLEAAYAKALEEAQQ